MEKITGVILAGGKGTRMNGSKPKVLMEIEGKPMIKRIAECFDPADFKKTIVVVGDLKSEIARVLASDIRFARQAEPKGTLDAFKSALPFLTDGDTALVVPADIPFLTKERLTEIIKFHYETQGKAVVVGMKVENPKGYGRLTIRNNRLSIIEEKEANSTEKMIPYVNTGIYVFPISLVKDLVNQVTNRNQSGEYYLTDLVALLAENDQIVPLYYPEDYTLKGVNDLTSLKSLLEEKARQEKGN